MIKLLVPSIIGFAVLALVFTSALSELTIRNPVLASTVKPNDPDDVLLIAAGMNNIDGRFNT